jgi:hypothetical protein
MSFSRYAHITNVCAEDENGGVHVWGEIPDWSYGLQKGGKFFGDKIDLDISKYKKVLMQEGNFYGID